MTQYKLTYFNGRGRAEVIRLIFAQAGVKYEDHRIAREAGLEPNTPFDCLPILEVDGVMLAGSAQIATFLAGRFGLAGTNDLENAQIAGILDYLSDLQRAFMTLKAFMYSNFDEARKAERKKKFDEEDAPKYLGNLERCVSAAGWLFGSKVSYVDLAFFNFAEYMPSETIAKYPGLKSVSDKVAALPNIAQWLKDRPKTQF